MWRPVPWLWLTIAVAVWGGWDAWNDREVRQLPGVLTAAEPLQRAVDSSTPAFPYKQYRLQPLAEFELDARVLSRKSYRFDAMASLVPTDLALGWGVMSDSSVLDKVDIGQSGRFMFWRVASFPVPEAEIIRHAANMHLIPSTLAIRRRIGALRVGQLISLRGKLVEARSAGGAVIRSSLRRDDTGAGACELVWVERLELQ